MRHKLRTALSFSWYDWWILFQAWVLLLAVDLGLRALPFPRVQQLLALGRKGAGDVQAGEAWATIQRLQRFVNIAGRNHLYPMRCLQRSLVLQWLLARRGIVADLQIGVQREAEGVRAHAWLEYEGRPIGESQPITAGFAPLLARGADR